MGTEKQEFSLLFEFEKATKNTLKYAEKPEAGQPPRIGSLYVQKWALGTGERLEASRHGNDRQHDALDTEDTQAVSCQPLGDDWQGSALPVGRDGVWWPHWSSKPVAGR
jgi:hypothetical protein